MISPPSALSPARGRTVRHPLRCSGDASDGVAGLNITADAFCPLDGPFHRRHP